MFDTYQKLSQFALCEQKTGDILKAIEMFQPIRSNQQKHVVAAHKLKGICQRNICTIQGVGVGSTLINTLFPFSNDLGRSGQILLKHKNFMTEINEFFLNLKLRQYIEFKFDRIDGYDHITHVSDYNDFVAICMQSSMAFRHFYKHTANAMIQHNFPSTMQQYLDQFISDVKFQRINIEDFYRMYDDDLYNYVKIVNEISNSSDLNEQEIAVNMLQDLREKCFLRFVVVVTHFNRFEAIRRMNARLSNAN